MDISPKEITKKNDLKDIAKDLFSFISKDDFVVWVGSGLSIYPGSPYKKWDKAVETICEKCGIDYFPKGSTPSEENLLEIAQKCKEKNENSYYDNLKQLYCRKITASTRKAYYLLLRLPFRAFVTTNFDPLFEDAFSIIFNNKNDIIYYPNVLPSFSSSCADPQRHFLFYIHGKVEHDGGARGDKLVFSKDEFEKAYSETQIVEKFIDSLLLNNNILFIACDLGEPPIINLLRKIRDIEKSRETIGLKRKRRLILVPTGGAFKKKIDEKRLIDAGFKIIEFTVENEDYSEIEKIFEYLKDMDAVDKQPQI